MVIAMIGIINMDLQSTVKQIGKTTTQVFHFVGNIKRTFTGIVTETIKEGEMLKVKTVDGRMLIINKANLLMTEVFTEDGK